MPAHHTRFTSEMTSQEISEALGIPVRDVNYLIASSLEKCRKRAHVAIANKHTHLSRDQILVQLIQALRQ
jgi:DNA-binding transcriptional regulator LsrR (DeoR family)